MKKQLIIIISLFTLSLNAQTIDDITISNNTNDTIKVDLTAVSGYFFNYLSHSCDVNEDEIDLTICYLGSINPVDTYVNNVFDIPINPDHSIYNLNIKLYLSTTNTICDYYALTDSATYEYSLTSISNLNEKLLDDINVYPIPTNNTLFFSINNEINIISVSIFNTIGSQLIRKDASISKISLKSLNSGIYLLNIETNQGNLIKKVVKK